MNTPTNAYFTKFSSGTILALLALSGILFLIPLASPVLALQNASSPSYSPSPVTIIGGGTGTAVSVTVSNPSTNAYAVKQITVIAPSSWSFGGTPCTAGSAFPAVVASS